MSTFDLTTVIINPTDNKPLLVAENKELTVRDAIITSFKMPTDQQEKLSVEELNFRRKVIQKLRKAEDLTQIALKSKAIEAIKEQVRKYYIPGIAMQIFEVFDGEYSDSTLEDI